MGVSRRKLNRYLVGLFVSKKEGNHLAVETQYFASLQTRTLFAPIISISPTLFPVDPDLYRAWHQCVAQSVLELLPNRDHLSVAQK